MLDIPDVAGVVVVVDDEVGVVAGCSTEITTVVPHFTCFPGARDWLVTQYGR